ncbi:MAG: hypothetical protein AAEJ43_02845, partial [Gammaproteobacteria bacterium]
MAVPAVVVMLNATDTTPDASLTVKQLSLAEIEYHRTLGAMLSVYWACSDNYTLFTRRQVIDKKFSKQSWENLREWAR